MRRIEQPGREGQAGSGLPDDFSIRHEIAARRKSHGGRLPAA
jgi:hypothetical protein